MRVAPAAVRPLDRPASIAAPARQTAVAPIDRMDGNRPTIPTRLPATTYRDAILAAARRGTPVHRGAGEHVTSAIASVLCLPGDVCRTSSITSARAFDTVTGGLARLWSGNAGAKVLAVLLGILAALPLVLLKLHAVLMRGLAVPFDLLRYGLNALGRAVTHEREVPAREANFRRIAPRDWPRLPENAAADAAVARYVASPNAQHYETDLLIVPGYATAGFKGPLHPRARARADQAARDFFAGRAPFILVSGGHVHPSNTPYNEAAELRRYLVDTLHVPADRVIVEPLAEHSPTNVRNAGRYMIANGLRSAEIVSDADVFGQTIMFSSPDAPGFGVDFRSRWTNGVSFGRYEGVDGAHTRYVPSDDVMLVQYDGEHDRIVDGD